VPRYPDEGTTELPTDWSTKNPARLIPIWVRGASSTVYGWPAKLHDNAVAHVPFVSDKCASGQGGGLNSPVVGYAVSDIDPNTAHFVNGILLGVNAAYADGHVEAHSPSQMQPAYVNTKAPNYWFY
jgi:prepilin-type processing-associated H-X9-DG protein